MGKYRYFEKLLINHLKYILCIAVTIAFNYFNYYIKDGDAKKASNQNLRKEKNEKEIVN